MGSLYEGKKGKGLKEEEISEKVVKPDGDHSEWNAEELCGFLSEKTIKEVMIKTGLVEEDHDKGLGYKVEPMEFDVLAPPEKWPMTGSWGVWEEEPPETGWIWYPYTDEELMSFEDEEAVWELALWNWKDISGIPK